MCQNYYWNEKTKLYVIRILEQMYEVKKDSIIYLCETLVDFQTGDGFIYYVIIVWGYVITSKYRL